jgi:hypothetical protein
VPLKLYWRLGAFMWKVRQSETPPGNLHFALHPWVVSNEKLKSLGWQPRHDTRETFEITMRAKGALDGEVPVEKPQFGQPVGA